ncbi:hypothetical protein ACFQ7J_07650 [Streptomyces sp. NPDC056501]|uniref:hypothetical protein n=1 Tax=Streptomyces sp. NPDC056501 TaxID=3345841 RepID=UPI003678C4CC
MNQLPWWYLLFAVCTAARDCEECRAQAGPAARQQHISHQRETRATDHTRPDNLDENPAPAPDACQVGALRSAP